MKEAVTKEGAQPQGGEAAVSDNKIIQFNEAVVKEHLDAMVLSTVEETLNALLDAEADRLCKAKKYVRTEERADTPGHYERQLHTKAGEVSLKG